MAPAPPASRLCFSIAPSARRTDYRFAGQAGARTSPPESPRLRKNGGPAHFLLRANVHTPTREAENATDATIGPARQMPRLAESWAPVRRRRQPIAQTVSAQLATIDR